MQFDNQLFSELYDVQPQAIIWMSPLFGEDGKTIVNFKYVYSNDEGLKFLNLSRDQFQTLTLSNSPTVSDAYRKSVFDDLIKVYTTQEKTESTVFNAVLKKHARLLRTKLRGGVLTVIQDITAEKKIIAELENKSHQLEQQKKLLDNILEKSSNGISVSEIFRDASGKVIDALTILANDAAVRFMGLPRDIYLTKKASELEPEVLNSPYYDLCVKTLETGEPFMYQYFMNATNRWLELTVSRLDESHLIQIFTDVTAIKKAHLEEEKAASLLKDVFNAAQTGMFTLEPVHNDEKEIVDFRFILANEIISSYVGREPGSLAGELASKWFPDYRRNGGFDMYKNSFLNNKKLRREVHYTNHAFDIYLEVQSVRLGDHVLVSIVDFTSLRKSQLELEQTIRALKLSNTYLEDFAHAASHDMKEPLRKILIFNERLKTSLGDTAKEEEAKYIDKIRWSTERMQILVDDLLEFSHVTEQQPAGESIDLNDKVERIQRDLELMIEEKKAQIISDPLPTIHGNRRQIQQLFHNLIVNALKYSKPDVSPVINITSRVIKGKEVAIELLSEQQNMDFYLIRVKDNGIGFDPKYSEKIFDMFQRLHRKSEYSGTGVGLSIVRKVVENHKGYIWAEGVPGVGATFNVMLPVSQ